MCQTHPTRIRTGSAAPDEPSVAARRAPWWATKNAASFETSSASWVRPSHGGKSRDSTCHGAPSRACRALADACVRSPETERVPPTDTTAFTPDQDGVPTAEPTHSLLGKTPGGSPGIEPPPTVRATTVAQVPALGAGGDGATRHARPDSAAMDAERVLSVFPLPGECTRLT